MNITQDKIVLPVSFKNEIESLIKAEKIKPINSLNEISGVALVASVGQKSKKQS